MLRKLMIAALLATSPATTAMARDRHWNGWDRDRYGYHYGHDWRERRATAREYRRCHRLWRQHRYSARCARLGFYGGQRWRHDPWYYGRSYDRWGYDRYRYDPYRYRGGYWGW